MALILVDGQGENLISVASGANHALTPAEIDQAADCIRSADVLMLQLEVPLDTVQRAAEIAAAADVPVILNPAPAAPLPDDLLRLVTYLTPNESEAGQLVGVAVHDETSARQAAERLLTTGTRHVIITLGAMGAQWTSPAGTVLIPSVAVSAVDTTAASDAFNGGLTWARLRIAVEGGCAAGMHGRRAGGHAARRPTVAAHKGRLASVHYGSPGTLKETAQGGRGTNPASLSFMV